MPIYKQSLNAIRMTGIRWAPPGKYTASFVGNAYCFDHLLCHFAIQQQSTAPQSGHTLLTQVRSMCS